MDALEALKILDEAVAGISADRRRHAIMMQAITVIREEINNLRKKKSEDKNG